MRLYWGEERLSKLEEKSLQISDSEIVGRKKGTTEDLFKISWTIVKKQNFYIVVICKGE